jgi:hypothetical protein
MIYNIQATNISNLEEISDYIVEETINQVRFFHKNHNRNDGALELAEQLIREVKQRVLRYGN